MEFNYPPFYDDFIDPSGNGQGAKDKNFLKILFRPGYAVQARELTQLQSILQNQIKNLGDFVFKDGSPVEGGHITFDPTVKGVKLQVNDDNSIEDFESKLVINANGPIVKKAMVVAVDDSTQNQEFAGTLVLKYLAGSGFDANEDLRTAVGTQFTATTAETNHATNGSIASINEGVFYVNGLFVYVAPQTIVLDSANTSPSFRVGLEIDETVVDESGDSSLLDPAQGSFNYQAPGAWRYQVTLTLSKRTLQSKDDSLFIELLRLENGIVTKKIDYPLLGNLEQTLARRTYDESGDYTVRPFKVTLSDDVGNNAVYVTNIEPGKAYVKGFEFETISTVKMTAPKARTTNTSSDYDLSLEYGNYVVAANLFSGNVEGFDTGNFGDMDLHYVPTQFINTAHAGAYANTKMGTAKVRSFDYAGDDQYYVYLLDVDLPPIVVYATGVAVNTSAIPLPTTFPAYDGILEVPVTILSGNSSGDVRTIVDYDESTKIAVVDRPFTQLIDSSSQLSIGFGVKDIESLVVTPNSFALANVYGAKNTSSALYPCMDIAPAGGKDIFGKTIIFSTELNKLVFPLPEGYIAQNSFVDVTFMNRKTLSSVSFATGNTTVGTGTGLDSSESFTFGFTNSYLPDNTARNNFLVVVRDKQTSNLSNGQVVLFDRGLNPGGNAIFQIDSTHVVIDCATTGSFLADILLNVRDSDAEINFRRTKTLIGDLEDTSLVATDAPTNGVAVSGAANTKIDAANGLVYFTSTWDISKAPGARQSLHIPDVVNVIAIYDSGNTAQYPNTTNGVDITDRYLFDSGQRDNYYDHASIILRDGAEVPAGQIVVKVRYYSHDATSGFFSADSYSASDYANGSIAYYSSEKFGIIALRDAIDFRPTRTIGTAADVTDFTINGLKLPQADQPMTLTYSFYLPRYDALVLTRDKQFKILNGEPAAYPKAPDVGQDSMVLYYLGVPPYTARVDEINLMYVENKRYTMRDIGSIDRRVEQLEYYTTLSELDAAASKQSILYQDGATAKEAYGIITDSFEDFSVADNGNPDLFCNLGEGSLMPYREVHPHEFIMQGATGPFKVNDRTYSMNFTEIPVVVQNTATKSISVQPFAFGQFRGDVDMRPQTDFWYSSLVFPEIVGPPRELPPPPPPPPAPIPVVPPVPPNTNEPLVQPQVVTSPPPPSPAPATGSVTAITTKVSQNYCFNRSTLSNPNGYYITLPNGKVINAQSMIGGFITNGESCFNVTVEPTGYGATRRENWYISEVVSNVKFTGHVGSNKYDQNITGSAALSNAIQLAAGGGAKVKFNNKLALNDVFQPVRQGKGVSFTGSLK